MRSLSRQQSKDTSRPDTLDLRAVLEAYGFSNLPSADSGWRKVRCDFHGERSPSATVNFEAGAFKCFACDMAGDTIKIIMLAEKKEGRPSDYNSACRKYQEITGKSPNGICESAPRFAGRAVATEARDYEEGDGFLRSRLRRNTTQRR